MLGVLGVFLLGTLGCAPSRFLARKMTEAPNRVPEFVKPEGRVLLRWPAGVLERFPSGKETLGQPAFPLHWVRVEPADYGLTVVPARDEGRAGRMEYTLGFRLPQAGLPPAGPARGTVFVLHGYGVDLETMFPWAVYLGEAGWRAILVDLRGHGRSGGEQVSFGVWETRDLRELRERLEARGETSGPYGVVGHSLGAALALRWQAMDPAIRGSVALGAFAQFVPAAERVRAEYASWLPPAWVRRAAERVPGILGVSAGELDTEAEMPEGRLRALLVASAQDAITPPDDSERLRERGGSGAGVWVVGGGTHETLPYLFEQHGRRVRDWLASEVADAGR